MQSYPHALIIQHVYNTWIKLASIIERQAQTSLLKQMNRQSDYFYSCLWFHMICWLQGDSIRTNIQLDFGDGTAVSYSNLSWTEEGIKHVYKVAGIVRVTALAENSLGYDTTTLYLHVTGR